MPIPPACGAGRSTPPAVDAPYYVGFETGALHVGLDPNGHAHGMTGPVGHWHVDDLAAAIARCAAAGGRLQQSLRDVGGREKIALVQDADGNVIGLPQPASA